MIGNWQKAHFISWFQELSAGICKFEISILENRVFFSKKNTAYWQGIKNINLGIGPSAHSMMVFRRGWNK